MSSPRPTIPGMLLRCVKEHGDHIAMRRKTYGVWKPWTWRAVGDEVGAIAVGLEEYGLKRGETVALIGDNEPELFWSEWAIQTVGGVAVCLYPDVTVDEMVYLLEDAQCSYVICEGQEQVDKLLEARERIPFVRRTIYWDPKGLHLYTDDWLLPLSDLTRRPNQTPIRTASRFEELVGKLAPDDLCTIMYSSGATGQPKGIEASHLTILDCATRYDEILRTFPGADYVSYISPAWATEQYLGMSLALMVPLVLNFPEEPDTMTEDLREIGAQFLFFSPRQWELIISEIQAKIMDAPRPVQAVYSWCLKMARRHEHASPGPRRIVLALVRWWIERLMFRPIKDRVGLLHVRSAMNSGGALSPDAFEFFDLLGVKIQNIYGFTEVGIVTATRDVDRRFDSVGTPLSTRWGSEPIKVTITEDGEILVRGGVPYLGYRNDPERTAERMTEDGWMRSGDAGFIDDQDGHLVYMDRLEHRRQLRDGTVFYPQFIETRLRMSPYIRDAMVLGDESRDFLAALIDIDATIAGRWAEKNSIPYSTYTDLSQRPEVRNLIRRELQEMNIRLPEDFQLRAFANLYKPLDPDEGELTRSRKLRREVVEDRYQDLINALYAGDDVFEADTEVRFRDGRVGRVRAQVSFEYLETVSPSGPTVHMGLR